MSARSSAFPVVMSTETRPFNSREEEITQASPEPEEAFHEALKGRRRLIRRRANRVQGRSLETLGHAVEYLVDSRMFAVEPSTAKAERDAVQILMRLSRMVFSECDEVVTVWDKVIGLWERPAKSRQGTAQHGNGVPQL